VKVSVGQCCTGVHETMLCFLFHPSDVFVSSCLCTCSLCCNLFLNLSTEKSFGNRRHLQRILKTYFYGRKSECRCQRASSPGREIDLVCCGPYPPASKGLNKETSSRSVGKVHEIEYWASKKFQGAYGWKSRSCYSKHDGPGTDCHACHHIQAAACFRKRLIDPYVYYRLNTGVY